MSIKEEVQEYFNTHEKTKKLMCAIQNLQHALCEYDETWVHLSDEHMLAYIGAIEEELAQALGIDASNDELIVAVEEFDCNK